MPDHIATEPISHDAPLDGLQMCIDIVRRRVTGRTQDQARVCTVRFQLLVTLEDGNANRNNR